MFAKSLIENGQARRIKLAHLRKMLGEIAAAQKFRQRSLRQLVGVQVGGLFHQAKTLDSSSGSNNPAHAQAGKCHLGKTVNVNHQIRTIQLLERWNALFASMQASVDVILDYRNL